MSDPNFSAIRARLRYESIDEFIDGYGRYISRGGMFVPMSQQKLKPVGTTVRFQFLLADGTSAMLGEGLVRQIKGLEKDSGDGPVGMLVKFSKLSPESKELVDQIVARKSGQAQVPEVQRAPQEPQQPQQPQAAVGADSNDDDTGVLAADAADALRHETGPGIAEAEDDTQERSLGELAEEMAADDGISGEVDSEPSGAPSEPGIQEQAASGDEIFGGQVSGQEEAAEDPSAAVADALGGDGSDSVGTRDPFDAPTPMPTPTPTPTPTDGQDSDGDGDDDDVLDNMFGGTAQDGQTPMPESSNAAETGEAHYFDDFDEPESDPQPTPGTGAELSSPVDDDEVVDAEPEFEPEFEPEQDVQESMAVQEPAGDDDDDDDEQSDAIKETEGGIKVMAFDEDDEVDEMATRDFEEFASGGEEEEIDAMFDDVFGGGGDDGGGLFGGGGDGDGGGGDDFFGGGGEQEGDGDGFFGGGEVEDESDGFLAGDQDGFGDAEEAAPAEAPQDDEEPVPAVPDAPGLGGEQSSEIGLEVGSSQVLDTADDVEDVAASSESFETFASEEPPERELFQERESTPEIPKDENVEEEISVREDSDEDDSSARIQSLLAMEDDEEPEMRLNLGGSLDEESSVDDDDEDDPDDSMESLLASAQQELDSKKKDKEKEEDDGDILDELLGDDDLPPAGAGSVPLDVPQPKSKKKKKGFMSKFFGGDD